MGRPQKSSRQSWSKIYAPVELVDLLFIIAKKHGYTNQTGHLFIYQMLKELYGEEVEKLADYLGTRWLEPPDPPPDD